MVMNSSQGLKYYQFNSLINKSITHAIFTRQGGVSPYPYLSLNVGGTSGDSRENVVENRKRMFDCMNLPVESIFDVWQVHGKEIIYTRKPRSLNSEHKPADIILTDQPGVTLFMRFADCVPILLFDPHKNAIGIVHAGWQGTVLKVAEIAVGGMVRLFGSNPTDIIAGIGPSIGPDHYEVGNKVTAAVEENLKFLKEDVLVNKSGKKYFDLWKSNEVLLQSSGVKQIETARLCTACNLDDWYSYRKEGISSGRFGAMIGLTGK